MQTLSKVFPGNQYDLNRDNRIQNLHIKDVDAKFVDTSCVESDVPFTHIKPADFNSSKHMSEDEWLSSIKTNLAYHQPLTTSAPSKAQKSSVSPKYDPDVFNMYFIDSVNQIKDKTTNSKSSNTFLELLNKNKNTNRINFDWLAVTTQDILKAAKK